MNMSKFEKLGYIAARTNLPANDINNVLRFAKEYESFKEDEKDNIKWMDIGGSTPEAELLDIKKEK